jgi:hypothetical protein
MVFTEKNPVNNDLKFGRCWWDTACLLIQSPLFNTYSNLFSIMGILYCDICSIFLTCVLIFFVLSCVCVYMCIGERDSDIVVLILQDAGPNMV